MISNDRTPPSLSVLLRRIPGEAEADTRPDAPAAKRLLTIYW